MVGNHGDGAIPRFTKGRPYYEQGIRDGEALAQQQMQAVEARFGWTELQSQIEAEIGGDYKQVIGGGIGSSVHRSYEYDEMQTP